MFFFLSWSYFFILLLFSKKLKVCLNEYLRAEHMCEGRWAETINEKTFYIILLKFKDYHDFK